MNNLALTQALAFEPRRAFTEMDARPRFWWPLLLVVLATAALSLWYMSVVDLEWLVDQQLRQSAAAASMTDEEIARVARAAASQRGLRMGVGTAITMVAVAIFLVLTAVYYLLAGKVTGTERSFRHWLALASWSALPTALALIPAGAALLTASSNQISQESLQPLSLNALYFDRQPGDPGYALLSNLNLLQLVSLYLAAFGVKVWSARSWLFSIVFTGLPYVLIYGTWAFFSLR